MLKTFYPELLRDGQPVILYGAAMYGELAYNALQNLQCSVFAFCDRVQAGKQFCGLNIISPEEVKNFPTAHVLICATKGFEGILHYLNTIGHQKYYEISDLLLSVKYEKLSPYCKALPINDLVDKYQFYLPQNDHTSSEFALSFVALGITERCTLRCKKCSVLAPYYPKARDDAYDDIIGPFQKFLSCIDSIAELQLGGGETLLHKDFEQILTWCLQQEKIKEVSIFSNSTILPNENLTKVLMNPRVKLLLDDYGTLSRKLPDILRLCDENGIRYVLQKFERWDDLGDYSDKRETDEQVEEKFRYCSFGNVISFLKGKLYRCTTAARIADLGLVPDDPSDYIDFTHEQDIIVWKKQIHDLLFEKKFHLGCRLCNGVSPYQLGIPVAEQLK